jgi:hypothetical protein
MFRDRCQGWRNIKMARGPYIGGALKYGDSCVYKQVSLVGSTNLRQSTATHTYPPPGY